LAQKQHFSILDGLRGVAALAVVVMHVTAPFSMHALPHGALAVDFFFVLSGFVVAFAYEDRLRSTMTFLEFCKARVFRLHPLIAAGMVFGAAGYVIKLHGSGTNLLPILTALTFGLLLIPTNALAGINASSHPLDTPAWSLLDEYLVNAAYAAIVKFLSNLALAVVIAVGALLVVASSATHHTVAVGNTLGDWPLGVARVIFPFFAGVAIYRAWRAGLLVKIRWPFMLLAMLIVVIFATPASWEWETASVLIAFPLIVAAGAHDRIGPRTRALALQAGRISYPIYILHYPFIPLFSHFARMKHLEGAALYGWLALEVCVMLAFAIAMTLLFDEPLRRWLSKGHLTKVVPTRA
jgi:peptidoglycan/LPS O-acetylase OafA/YrhL